MVTKTNDWARRLNLSDDERAALERIAAEEERSQGYVLRKAFRAFLARRKVVGRTS